MKRKAAVGAASLAVLAPLALGLAMRQPGTGRAAGTGCTVRNTAEGGGLRLAVTLELAGSVEVRVGGQVVTQQDEPAGESTITTATGGVLAVTEWTSDGELIVCGVRPG